MGVVFRPGTELRGKYRVERVLGSGGMGVVLLATHLRMDRLVALKLLLPDARGQDDVVRRFAREARAAARLASDHAIRILDVDDSEAGDPFLVMEYLEGSDLQQVLQTRGPLPAEDAVAYVLQACAGLAEAHAAGIVHRDLKPANLFLTSRPDGAPLVKILDFGISKATTREGEREDPLVTRPATAIGSPAYMSPEQIKSSAEVDARSDLWSLGVVLYQLLTNRLPFEATSTAALAARIAADPPAPMALSSDASAALEAVVMRCLEKSPSARFADAPALARALAPWVSDGEVAAARVAAIARTARATSTPPRARDASLAPTGEPTHTPDRAEGPETRSFSGPAPKAALQRALVTEYASTVAAGTTDARAVAQSSRRRAALVGALGVLAFLGGATWLGVGARSGHAPAVQAPAPSTSQLVENEAGAGPTAWVDAAQAASATPVPSSSSSARPTAPVRTRKSTTPKNPLEIEFR